MKKIYVVLLTIPMLAFIACGGEEKKKEDNKEGEKTEEETEEPAEEEAPKVDYSYVVPKIDTAALTTEAQLIDAMKIVVKARKLDDSLSTNATDYTGYYTELTTLYTTVLQKGTAYAGTLKPKEAVAFNEKFSAAQE